MSNQQPETVTIHVGGSVSGQVVGGRGNVAEFRQATVAQNEALASVRPDQNGTICGIVVADVQASGQLNSRQQRRMRSELLRMFVDGVAALGQRWTIWTRRTAATASVSSCRWKPFHCP